MGQGDSIECIIKFLLFHHQIPTIPSSNYFTTSFIKGARKSLTKLNVKGEGKDYCITGSANLISCAVGLR